MPLFASNFASLIVSSILIPFGVISSPETRTIIGRLTASFTASHAIIYDDSHASDALVCSFDFGGAQTVSAGTFTIQWAATGILRSS